MSSEFIYHMCPKSGWREAVQTGEYAGTPLDLKDGFIHFSTADQVEQTAALHLSGVAGLVLLKVPVDAVTDALKWEKSCDGALFPHLYRPLKCDEVIDVTELELDDEGRHQFPPLS
ncbi:MAG: DUF952 domain-containing protein [Alphaproteobacteria bacterium]